MRVPPNIKKLAAFIKERHSIYEKKLAGLPKPWTTDEILQSYRFCNVYRELDAVTKWIAINWREPNQDHPDLWFAMAIARYINWPDTLSFIGYPTERGWKHNIYNAVSILKDEGKQVYSGAYMISTHGEHISKNEYIVERVLTNLWAQRKQLRIHNFANLEEMHNRLSMFHGVGSFMAAQIIADIKYARPYIYPKMMDWWNFAASGPGSRRGLNRVMGNPVDAPWKEQQWRYELSLVHAYISEYVDEYRMPSMHAQDLQNCLCEFDKYERVRLGEGRPKSRYAGI
jgi:hypothetical protein